MPVPRGIFAARISKNRRPSGRPPKTGGHLAGPPKAEGLLIGFQRRKDVVGQRTGIGAAVAFADFFLCLLNDIRPVHGADAGEGQYLGRRKKPFVGQGAAGLGDHLPGMPHVPDAGRRDIDVQGGSRVAHVSHVCGTGAQYDLCRIKGMDLGVQRLF